jgi:hypothetical protein
MNDTEWELERAVHHEAPQIPFARIALLDHRGVEGRYVMYISRGAYERLGSPEYVQINVHRIAKTKFKLVPCDRLAKSARKMRTGKGAVRLGGGPKLIKHYNMPHGYYMMDENNVFIWERQ